MATPIKVAIRGRITALASAITEKVIGPCTKIGFQISTTTHVALTNAVDATTTHGTKAFSDVPMVGRSHTNEKAAPTHGHEEGLCSDGIGRREH